MKRVGSGLNTSSDWIAAHEELSKLAKHRAALDFQEGWALLRARRSGVHCHLGYGSFNEYVERLFGDGPRTIEEKLRTAEALEGLPELGRSLRDGALSWSAARELTRVATPQTEIDWLSVARGKTVRQVEELVSGRALGDLPSDPARAEARRHVLRFAVSAETFATFRKAVAHLRRKSTDGLDDDALLMLVAREILQGPGDDGRASYQIAVTTCASCRRGFQQGGGELIELAPAAMEQARCDAQHVGALDVVADSAEHAAHVGGKAAQEIPPSMRRRVVRRDGGRCAVPGCRHATFVDLHHLTPRSEGGNHEDDNLVVLCGVHHGSVHRGQLVIGRPVSSGLQFSHADGTPYGQSPSALEVGVRERAFRCLRSLGFSEKEAKQALDRVTRKSDSDLATTKDLLRAALSLLAETALTPGRRIR